MKTILVTGVGGFVGKHLVREITSRGHKAVGVGLGETAHPEIAGLLDSYFSVDLTDQRAVSKLPLESVDVAINLAGLANAGASFGAEEKYLKVNVEVATVLAEEILHRKLRVRFIAISTGAVYDSHQAMPLTEGGSSLITQGSPYARSKILMEEALRRLEKQALGIVIVRPFNHIGPGQEPGFLVPDLYKKISTAQNTSEPLQVGNLSTKRDYTDVRDVARAYVNLAEADNLKYNLYNVCTGKSLSGEVVLRTLLSAMGAGEVKLEQDSSLIRPNDPKDLFGDNQRISEVSGWHPTIALEQTIKDFVEYERQK